MEVEARFWVRVLVLDDASQCRIEASEPLTVLLDRGTKGAPSPQSGSDVLGTAVDVSVQDEKLHVAGRVFKPGEEVEIRPASPYTFRLDRSGYRGTLHLVFARDGRSFDAVNWVPMEPYLAGVVGAEMPYYWEPQALKAQAVAARTYCWHIKGRFGAKRHWDVARTEAHQVYRGLAGESAQVWAAVNASAGQVLAVAGEGKDIFPTYYSAICGGHTEDSEAVFGESYGPLQGVPCPYCRPSARVDQFYWPAAQIDKRTASERLGARYPSIKALGSLVQIELSRQSDYDGFSRITQVRVVGSGGKKQTLRAEDLRLALDPTGRKIRSACFRLVDQGEQWAFLAGRGWGHGVGLCQTGAQGMARQGRTAEQILAHYYPGSQIVRLYGQAGREG